MKKAFCLALTVSLAFGLDVQAVTNGWGQVSNKAPVWSLQDPCGLGNGFTLNGVRYTVTNNPVITVERGVSATEVTNISLYAASQVTVGSIGAVGTNDFRYLNAVTNVTVPTLAQAAAAGGFAGTENLNVNGIEFAQNGNYTTTTITGSGLTIQDAFDLLTTTQSGVKHGTWAGDHWEYAYWSFARPSGNYTVAATSDLPSPERQAAWDNATNAFRVVSVYTNNAGICTSTVYAVNGSTNTLNFSGGSAVPDGVITNGEASVTFGAATVQDGRVTVKSGSNYGELYHSGSATILNSANGNLYLVQGGGIKAFISAGGVYVNSGMEMGFGGNEDVQIGYSAAAFIINTKSRYGGGTVDTIYPHGNVVISNRLQAVSISLYDGGTQSYKTMTLTNGVVFWQ